MSPGERQALKDIIRQFKNPEDSDFDAALNILSKHAKTIRALQDQIDELRKAFETYEKVYRSIVESNTP